MKKTKIELLNDAINKVKNNGGTNPIKTKGGDLLSLVKDIIDSLVQVDDFNTFFSGEAAGKKRIKVEDVLNLLGPDGKILPNLYNSTGGNSFTPQNYTFTNQSSINITHNLGRKPIVKITTDTGESVLFDEVGITSNAIVLNFNFHISGTLTYF